MGAGLPKQPEQFHKIPHARVAIVGSSWHSDCVNAMINRAEKELLALDVAPANISIHTVPGSLELPLAARILLKKTRRWMRCWPLVLCSKASPATTKAYFMLSSMVFNK